MTPLQLAQGPVDAKDIRQTPLAPQAMVANSLNSITLPLVGTIIGVEGEIAINHDNDATGDTPEEDGLGRIITSINIRDGGGYTYFDAHDGRLLQYLTNFTEGRLAIWPSILATVTGGGGARTEYRNFVIDFQDTPVPGGRRDVDPLGGIITREKGLNELTFQIRMGTFADLSTASDLTVNSITITLTPIIVRSQTESGRLLLERGVAKPMFRGATQAIAVGTAFGYEFDLPRGFLLSKSVLIAVDASNDRGVADADIVSAIGYKDILAGQIPWETGWADYRRSLQSRYFGDGVTFADWTNVALVDWPGIVGGQGLRRSHRQQNDDVLMFTGAATGSLFMLHKGFTRYV